MFVWLILAGYCLSVATAAAKASASAKAADDSSSAGVEKVGPVSFEDEIDGSESDPFRTKRQHDAAGNPITGLFSSVFNKKLGLLGSLSSISSASKGIGAVDTHHTTYEYTVS